MEGFPNRMIYQYGMPVENKFDYGISGGIGGEFSINRRNSLYLEARYYFGLGNMLPIRSYRTFQRVKSDVNICCRRILVQGKINFGSR